jgi:hypothetical protein
MPAESLQPTGEAVSSRACRASAALNADTCSRERSTSRSAACTISTINWPCRSATRHGALGQTSGNRLSGEVPATIALFRFEISKPTNRLTCDIDPDVLCCSVRVADKGCHAAGVEDAIKIFTRGLDHLFAFVDFECAGIERPLQTFRGFLCLLEQHGVALCSSGALGNEPKQHFAWVDSRVPEIPTEELCSNGRLGNSWVGWWK